MSKAFTLLLKSADGRKPKLLQTDRGKEFYNKTFQELLEKENIRLYSTYSVMKAAVVERFNRTLKQEMWKDFSARGSYRWLDTIKTHLVLR